MRTRRILGTIALALVLAVGLSASLKAKPDHAGPPEDAGPAEKATGGIKVKEGENWAWVDFNAHEAKGNRDAKGTFWWWLGGKDDPTHTIKVDVEYVKVEGDTAWFAGMAVKDEDENGETGNKIDDWFFVKAYDGGTPATDGDQIWWQWLGEEPDDGWPEDGSPEDLVENMENPLKDDDDDEDEDEDESNEKPILAGNLVVHTKGGPPAEDE